MKFTPFCFVVITLSTLLLIGISSGQESAPKVARPSNPHSDNGDCSVCHVAPVEKLRGFRSWFVSGEIKRELITDHTTLCRKCHPDGFKHGAGKKMKKKPMDIPLSEDGVVNCATSCHNMHITDVEEENQQYYHLRYLGDKLCVKCHE